MIKNAANPVSQIQAELVLGTELQGEGGIILQGEVSDGCPMTPDKSVALGIRFSWGFPGLFWGSIGCTPPFLFALKTTHFRGVMGVRCL